MLLEEGQVEEAVDHHPRTAGKNFNLFEVKKLLVKIAELFWLLGNKGDMSQFAHD
jgi:hypothetical protein